MKRVSIGVAEVADTMDAFESQPEESKGDTDHSVAVRGSLYYQSQESAVRIINSNSSAEGVPERDEQS